MSETLYYVQTLTPAGIWVDYVGVEPGNLGSAKHCAEKLREEGESARIVYRFDIPLSDLREEIPAVNRVSENIRYSVATYGPAPRSALKRETYILTNNDERLSVALHYGPLSFYVHIRKEALK